MPRTSINLRRSRSVGPRGLTLIELLLVVALIVLIVALALPVMYGAFRAGSLTAGTDKLRTLMAEARLHSMSTGQVYSLRMPDEQTLEIGPAGDALDENELSSGNSPPVITAKLPEGIHIAGLMQLGEDARTPGGAAGGGGGTQVGTAPTSGDPLAYFYPDGTCSNVEIELNEPTGLTKIVALRGLTGASSVKETATDSANPYLAGGGVK